MVEKNGLNLNGMHKFNDGIDGIMALPKMNMLKKDENKINENKESELEEKKNAKEYIMKKIELKDLNNAKKNFAEMQLNFKTRTEKKKHELNMKKKRLFSINNLNDGNIPLMGSSEAIKWKIPSFQKIKNNNNVINVGSINYGISELSSMRKDKNEDELEIGDDENEIMNDIDINTMSNIA